MKRKTRHWEYRGVSVEPSEDGQYWRFQSAPNVWIECPTKPQAQRSIDSMIEAREERRLAEERGLQMFSLDESHPFLHEVFLMPSIFGTEDEL